MEKDTAVNGKKKRGPLAGRPKPPGFGARLSKILTGKKRTPEQRRRISEAKMGGVVSDETKAKISAANSGRKRTTAQRRGMAIAQRRRYERERAEKAAAAEKSSQNAAE